MGDKLKNYFPDIYNNPCDRYISVWCIYSLQGFLYPSGSILSQLLALVILFMTYRTFIFFYSKKNNVLFVKAIILMTLVYTFYGLLLLIVGGDTHGLENRTIAIDYIKNFFISIPPILTFYYYAQNGYLTKESIRKWIPFFVIVGVCSYYAIQKDVMVKLLEAGVDSEGVTNNAGYIFLYLIPPILLLKKTWSQILGILICFLFIMFAMKRGAILIGVVVVLTYFFYKLRTFNLYYKVIFLGLVVIVSYLTIDILEDSLFQNAYFLNRVESTLEGKTSGRDNIAKMCIDYYINKANVFEMIIGLGPNGTITVANSMAHNDWLETLIDQGLIGIMIFVCFLWGFVRYSFNNSWPKEYRFAWMVIFFVFFVRSFLSMSIIYLYIYSSCVMGLCMASNTSRIIKRKSKSLYNDDSSI